MSSESVTHRGIIHGNTIQFESELGLPDGQAVNVTLEPVRQALTPGEGIRRSAGAWTEDAVELDEFLEWNRQQRKVGRRDIAT